MRIYGKLVALISFIVIISSVPVYMFVSAQETCTIHGYVYDMETGIPIPDAYIDIYCDDIGYWNSTYTDGTGYYEMNCPAGHFEIYCHATDYYSYNAPVDISDGEILEYDIYLYPMPEENSTIHGYVYDVKTGKGLQEVLIGVSDARRTNYTNTNASGYYLINVSCGILSISASLDNYFEYHNIFEIGNNTTIMHDIDLYPIPKKSGKIIGYVRYADGTPVKNADVRVANADTMFGEYVDITHTNSSGYYEFDIYPGRFLVSASIQTNTSSTGYGLYTIVGDNETVYRNFTIDLSATIVVNVTDDGGNPLYNVPVIMWDLDHMYVSEYGGYGLTDSMGTFSANVSPGNYSLLVIPYMSAMNYSHNKTKIFVQSNQTLYINMTVHELPPYTSMLTVSVECEYENVAREVFGFIINTNHSYICPLEFRNSNITVVDDLFPGTYAVVLAYGDDDTLYGATRVVDIKEGENTLNITLEKVKSSSTLTIQANSWDEIQIEGTEHTKGSAIAPMFMMVDVMFGNADGILAQEELEMIKKYAKYEPNIYMVVNSVPYYASPDDVTISIDNYTGPIVYTPDLNMTFSAVFHPCRDISNSGYVNLTIWMEHRNWRGVHSCDVAVPQNYLINSIDDSKANLSYTIKNWYSALLNTGDGDFYHSPVTIKFSRDTEKPHISYTVEGDVNGTYLDDHWIVFNASGCTDNCGISNYTWTLGNMGNTVEYYSCVVNTTLMAGIWNITLSVSDYSGNINTTTFNITVKGDFDGDYIADDVDDDDDNDGMPDTWEESNGLDPKNASDAGADSDNDGLTNYEEYENNTDPTNNDTDNDGMPDGWEVDNNLSPTNASDATADNDNDGLTNAEEYNNGTDPNDSDTDNDDMPDGWEVENGLKPTENDANEDADGDGVSNIDEYKEGTNPLNPASKPPRKMDKLMLYLIIGIVIAIIAILAIIVMMRGKKPKTPTEEQIISQTPQTPVQEQPEVQGAEKTEIGE